jgi:plastocyanin
MNARLAPMVGGLVLAAIALAGCGSSMGGSYSNPMSPSPAPSPAPGPAPVAATLTIGIVGMSGDKSFAPNPSSIAAGQTVAFYNGDSITHRIAANGGAFDTGNLGPGATSAPFTMPTAGAFAYLCTIHPTMVGTLNVTDY